MKRRFMCVVKWLVLVRIVLRKRWRLIHRETLQALLEQAQIKANAGDFRRYGSARQLYHFKVDHADAY